MRAEGSHARLVDAVLASSKYRGLCRQAVERAAARRLGEGLTGKEAEKRVRADLHQMTGAYLASRPPYHEWIEELRRTKGDPDDVRSSCLRMLGRHASTRERLDEMQAIYGAVFEASGEVRSVLDLACGLNPLSLPWMPLPRGSRYIAVDLFDDLAAFLNEAIPLLGHAGNARAADALVEPPTDECDLALLMKCVPIFERSDEAATERLLASLRCRLAAVTYPSASLGGRDKGMRSNYERRFARLAERVGWKYKKLGFRSEIVFLASLDKGASSLQ